LGNAYESLGDYDSAIAAQNTSLALAQSSQAAHLEATALMNLGGLYSLQGDIEAAIAQYQTGIALARDLGNVRSAAYGLNNLGGAYQQQGDFQQAIAHFQESLALAEQTGNRALQATVLTNLGVAQEDLGALETALAAHKQSVAIARTLEDPKLLANALNNLAHTQLQTGDLGDAETALQESVALLATLREGLTDADKVAVFDTQIYTYNLLMQVQVAQGDYEAALEASEQGRARALVDLVAGQEQAPSAPNIDEIRQVAHQLNATLVEYAVVPEEDFTVQGRQRGKAGQIFIWVVAPSGEISFRQVALGEVDLSLNDQVQQSRSALGALGRVRGLGVQATTNAPAATSQLQQIHQQLIDPIADVLPSNPDDLVVLIPHESLFYLPFAALQDAEGRYLVERHTLLTAPTIQLLDLTLETAPTTPAAQSLVVGNPTMPSETTLQPLPGAEAEAAAIARIFDTEAILGDAATESRVVDRMQDANVIHLATHGLLDYVDDRDRVPIAGAIALAPSDTADGFLTAREISQLSLTAQLVVLSACDTGLGEVTGDGVVGLSRSLLAAGADSTVVSLWAVPDAPTADLMVAFYEGLQRGENKAVALRQAMLQTMEAYPNPLAWAAFVLVGNPMPLQNQ
jgi:CHAT domain-containing protein/Tfp pilus assembly protein PilF